MLEIFSYEFMQRAFSVGIIVAIIAPTIGIFFVVRRYSAIADTLAHTSLAGIALSLVTGFASIPTAFVVSALSILGMEKLREKKTLPADTLVSLFLFGGLASGVVLLGLAKGKNANVMNYLFGNILTVTQDDILSVGVIGGFSILIAILLWKPLFAVSLDEETAEANGLPVRWLNRILAILGAATIAISMQVVGVLLIGALMVIPVLAAMQFHLGFKKTWVLSLVCSVASVVIGLFASYVFNLASGGTIVLAAIGCFIFASFFSKATV